MVIKELRWCKGSSANNVVGERGEYLVMKICNSTTVLPQLLSATIGTENMDGISRKQRVFRNYRVFTDIRILQEFLIDNDNMITN